MMTGHDAPRARAGRPRLWPSIALSVAGSYALLGSPAASLALGSAGFLLNALLLLLLVLLAVRAAGPADWRAFLALRPFDARGALYGLGLFALYTLAERALLGPLLFAPLSGALRGQGLTFAISFFETGRLSAAVLLLPAAEELFFRGYVQRQLQPRIGRNRALVVATIIWSLWHVWAPQEFFRRLAGGLCVEGLLFRWRQNTWPSLIVHVGRVLARAALG